MSLQGRHISNFLPFFGISVRIGQKVQTVIRIAVVLVLDTTCNIKLSIKFCNIKIKFGEAKLAAVF